MRWLYTLALLLAGSVCDASTITAMVQRVTGAWATNAVITFFPSNTPAVINGGFTTTAAARMIVGTNGWASNNLVTGNYRFQIDQGTRDFGTVFIPNDSATYDLVTRITSTNVLFASNIFSAVLTSQQATNFLATNVNTVSFGGSVNIGSSSHDGEIFLWDEGSGGYRQAFYSLDGDVHVSSQMAVLEVNSSELLVDNLFRATGAASFANTLTAESKIIANGIVNRTNGLALASITATITNGDCWVGMLSNTLQAVCMSNNAVRFKVLAPLP